MRVSRETFSTKKMESSKIQEVPSQTESHKNAKKRKTQTEFNTAAEILEIRKEEEILFANFNNYCEKTMQLKEALQKSQKRRKLTRTETLFDFPVIVASGKCFACSVRTHTTHVIFCGRVTFICASCKSENEKEMQRYHWTMILDSIQKRTRKEVSDTEIEDQ